MKGIRHGSKNRFQIMPYEQILRLFRLLTDQLMICCEIDSDEPLFITLWEIIAEMKSILEAEDIPIKDVRLIGGAATYVISCSDSFCYKDIDIVFSLHSCNNFNTMDTIRKSVIKAVKRLMGKYEEVTNRDCYPEKYIKKQVCVQNRNLQDYWSLFSLGCCSDTNSDVVELKFANSIERQYECSVDSFQIVLDPALHFITHYGTSNITKDVYPTVVYESVWGSVKDALSHLRNKYIVIEQPEQIRGGGLLKYCKLLVDGFHAHPDLNVKYVEKYMCSRFFIDFPLLTNQQDKIISYVLNHFPPNRNIHTAFLKRLSHVVKTSSVYVGIDRLRSVFLINSLSQEIWALFQPRICLSEFNDRKKWSVGEIMLGSSKCHYHSISSSSSISTPREMSPDQSLDNDSSHDDSSVT